MLYTQEYILGRGLTKSTREYVPDIKECNVCGWCVGDHAKMAKNDKVLQELQERVKQSEERIAKLEEEVAVRISF